MVFVIAVGRSPNPDYKSQFCSQNKIKITGREMVYVCVRVYDLCIYTHIYIHISIYMGGFKKGIVASGLMVEFGLKRTLEF